MLGRCCKTATLPSAAARPPASPRPQLPPRLALPRQQPSSTRLHAFDGSSLANLAVVAEIGFDELSATASMLGGANERVVLFASVLFSTLSLGSNLWGGMATEKKRAELALELEHQKERQKQLAELYAVTARYRGPLLESVIDLEQALWHLLTSAGRHPGGGEESEDEGSAGQVPWAADEPESDMCYLLFTLAQFLGFLEVLRREGPRERAFLQGTNPHGSGTLSTLVEGIRFVLCASQSSLQRWYLEGRDRPHPGCRSRGTREEVVRECVARRHGTATAQRPQQQAPASPDAFRCSRGVQRAIGSFMISTPIGAQRHYTMSYGDFHARMEADPVFRRWFRQLEADADELGRGPGWAGQAPFPAGRWTRILLLQQLSIELIDLLDPDCVRVPLANRTRLMPMSWGRLPGVEEYQSQLKTLAQAFDVLGEEEEEENAGPSLEGLRDLLLTFGAEEAAAALMPLPADEATQAQEERQEREQEQRRQEQQQEQQRQGQEKQKQHAQVQAGQQQAADGERAAKAGRP